MKLEKIVVRGMLAFADAVTVDLAELPPGLIAIAGPNGHGKTTLLESGVAALYRTFPSRDGELFDYATSRDSFIETTYAMEGRGTFRARVSLDGPKRNADAVLLQVLPDAQGGHMIPLNPDGKVSTFDQVVAKHFPPRQLVLASAFAAQNRAGSFVTLDKKGRKELFGQLLGLSHYDAMSATAKSCAGLVDTTRGKLVAARDALVPECSTAVVDGLDRLAHELQTGIGDHQVRRSELRTLIDGLDARLADVQDAAATYLAASMRLQTLESDLTRSQQRWELLGRAIGEAEDRLRADVDLFRAERDRELVTIANKIANNEGLRDRAEAIRLAAARVVQVAVELDQARGEEQAFLAQRRALEQAVAAAERRVEACHRAAGDLERVRTDSAILGRVPCHAVGEYAACSFLTNAQTATLRIPGLESVVNEQPALEAQIAERRLELVEVNEAVSRAQTRIAQLQNERTAAEPLAGLAEKLAAAEARIAELHGQEEASRTRTEQRIEDAQQRTAAEIARLTAERVDLLTTINITKVEIASQRSIRDANDHGHSLAARIQQDLTAARAAWDEVTRELAVLDTRHTELQRRRHDVMEKRVRLDGLHRQIQDVDRELTEWQLLQRVLSKDGLQTLEIDAAGPLVSAYANDLLTSCFGPKFTLELITQDAKITKGKDGSTTKEVFSIRVFDNEFGSEPRDISDLSGGEQVIVDEALKNAIAIFANERSQTPMRTCWRDETTGALHPENAARYVTMLRRVLALGHFFHVIFVTHNRDAALAADAQIVVADGHATTRLPPFQEA